MYGSETTDLIVKYFDEAIGVGGEAEMAWYLSKARAYGGPVLDLACGTGRLALRIAQEGFEVTGIDRSAGMLSRFRRKLEHEPREVRARVNIENQTMSEFDLDARFGTIICCDAFFHNLTVAEETACLERVASHLADDGGFVFNLPNPTCAFIAPATEPGGTPLRERGRYSLRDGTGTLIVEDSHSADPLEQTVTTTLRITRCDADGAEVERGESTWSSRYLYRWEAVHLLHRCGLEVRSLVGDYQGGPVTEAGQLVFEAVLCRPAFA